jgi:hypothetical protein
LANKFCIKYYKNGGVSIFIQGKIQFSKINLNEFCNDKDLEISAIKLLLSAIQVQTLDRIGDSGSTPGQALLRQFFC